MNLTSLDSLGTCESIYVHFKTIKLEKHEFNHFNDNRNTILNLFWSLTSQHEMARETKIQSFHFKLVHFIFQQGIMPYRRGHSDTVNIDANKMDMSKIDSTIYRKHSKRFLFL